ncbi:MAG: Gfo/Idh/MocA family oxidoreductase [Anaerolineae bacterium]|nr:Gfo/Idh/MocA family oxidoreductase [Anaerolineae bacterium]
MHKITMLGTGLIGAFYTMALQGKRSQDRVHVVCSRSEASGRQFADRWGAPHWTTDLRAAIFHPETDVVVIGLPNDLHEQAVALAAEAGKAVLCTKPLGRTAAEAKRMLDLVEQAGVFHGYLEDLAYPPKTRKAVQSVQQGMIGKVLWARAREAHPGPHSDWFFDREQAGGGAIIDMGCHCMEVSRNFIGKAVRPVEVMCWADTQVHPIDAEDTAIGLVRYANGAIGQFEASWAFRGGMDLRDEITGTEGTIWLNHWQRTGFELFTSGEQGGYVAEKTESDSGWLFPVGDDLVAMGFEDMFADMLNALDAGTPPLETFYDGYVVNAIIDAAYRSVASRQWEPVDLPDWRGDEDADAGVQLRDYDAQHYLVKRETMPDGSVRLILKEKASGKVVQRHISA